MKAWPAVTELRLIGVVYCLVGVAATLIAVAHGERNEGLFFVIVAAALGVAAVAHLAWTVRAIRRAEPAPQALVIGTRWRTCWQRVVPSCFPVAAGMISAAAPSGSTWVLGVLSLVPGAFLVVEAAVAARVERTRSARVVRIGHEQRFVLAH